MPRAASGPLGTYLGMREAGAPLATSGSNADCPLPLLSWRLWEESVKTYDSVEASSSLEKGRLSTQRELKPCFFSWYPISRTELSPIHTLLHIFSLRGPLLTDSHPKHQLLQLPAGHSSLIKKKKSLFKFITLSQNTSRNKLLSLSEQT